MMKGICGTLHINLHAWRPVDSTRVLHHSHQLTFCMDDYLFTNSMASIRRAYDGR